MLEFNVVAVIVCDVEGLGGTNEKGDEVDLTEREEALELLVLGCASADPV